MPDLFNEAEFRSALKAYEELIRETRADPAADQAGRALGALGNAIVIAVRETLVQGVGRQISEAYATGMETAARMGKED